MKKIAALVALSSMMASAALAGGPMVVAEPVEPIAAIAPASSGSVGAGAVVAGLAGLALVAALAGGSSSGTTDAQ